jgi:PST family polysaccharide transporter
MGVGIAHMVVAVGVMLPAFLLALRGLGVRPLSLAQAVTRPALGAFALVLVPLVVTRVLDHDLAILLIGGIGGLLLYLPVVAPMRRSLEDLKNLEPASPAPS